EAGYLTVAAILLLAIALAGCSSDDDGGRASAIVCTTAYRVSTSEPLTEEDHLRIPDEDSEQSLPYIYLALHAQYWDGRADNERALRLWVTPTGEDDVLVAHLLQLPTDSGPEN